MTKTRNMLSQLIKEWAQSHNRDYNIIDPSFDDLGMINTEKHFTWLFENYKSNKGEIDLLGLLNLLEEFVNKQNNRKSPDGMFCRNCTLFYEYAEPNQPDGTLLCFSCRQNPY